jgi:hypothetical protein
MKSNDSTEAPQTESGTNEMADQPKIHSGPGTSSYIPGTQEGILENHVGESGLDSNH